MKPTERDREVGGRIDDAPTVHVAVTHGSYGTSGENGMDPMTRANGYQAFRLFVGRPESAIVRFCGGEAPEWWGATPGHDIVVAGFPAEILHGLPGRSAHDDLGLPSVAADGSIDPAGPGSPAESRIIASIASLHAVCGGDAGGLAEAQEAAARMSGNATGAGGCSTDVGERHARRGAPTAGKHARHERGSPRRPHECALPLHRAMRPPERRLPWMRADDPGDRRLGRDARSRPRRGERAAGPRVLRRGHGGGEAMDQGCRAEVLMGRSVDDPNFEHMIELAAPCIAWVEAVAEDHRIDRDDVVTLRILAEVALAFIGAARTGPLGVSAERSLESLARFRASGARREPARTTSGEPAESLFDAVGVAGESHAAAPTG